jgi:hypothetical protein
VCSFNVRNRQHTALSTVGQLNPLSGITSWFHPFTYKRFHVLLNSLFKVLCNFPSRYLFAIGFAVIFSFIWSLPHTLGCTLKQPDSNVPQQTPALSLPLWAYHPLWERALVKGTCGTSETSDNCYGTHAEPPLRQKTKGLCAELFPFHSPLLRESHLVSFPPLNNMLKFSG